MFSALVGIYGTKALDQNSVYEKVRHLDVAQTKFPDLKRRHSGPKPTPEQCLESKGSKRPWAIQSHYNHPGWYIVWRYLVDVTARRPVLVWRVDSIFLKREDWKYEPSKAGAGQGGRTHTFGLQNPRERLRSRHAFQKPGWRLRASKPVYEPDAPTLPLD